jgi:outer membrane protein assembly factor BamB
MAMTGRRAARAWRIARGAAIPAAALAVALAVPGSGLALATGGADWPQYHFNVARSGMTTETTIGTSNVSTLTTLWSKPLPASSVTSPVVMQDKAGTDLLYAGDAAGTFFAYNAVTGAPVWSNNLGTKPIQKVAFVGGIRGSLFGLSVATGAKLWTSPGTSAGYYASPAVSRGRVLDVDLNGQLSVYALPAAAR